MEFINFEDVKESLRDEVAKEFINELSTLRSQQTNHELQIANLKKSYELEWVKHTANTDNTISKITEDYQKEIDNLKLKIEELETGNKKKTEIEELNHKIEGLEKALEEERSKKWYSKLFK